MSADRADAGASPRRAGIFTSTVTLGRVAGIDVGVNWTWLLIFALMVWSLAGVEFPDTLPGRSAAVYAGMGATAALGLFGSLILHELGHALRARREGVSIQGITLWLFGGVAKIAGEFPSAGAEFRIAVAGPLVSLALGVAFVALAVASPITGAVETVAAWLGYINLALLVFNFLPAMPLDGGRVLRAALWARGHDLSDATHRAARIGTFLAAAIIVLGLVETLAGALGGIWLAVIGWFILEAGRAEEQQVVTRHALASATVGALMTRRPVAVDADDTLAAVARQIAGTSRHTSYPVMSDHTVVGLLPLRAFAGLAEPEWWARTAADLMIPAERVPQLAPDTPAMTALDELNASGVGRGLVLKDGRLTGIISITDLARALAVGRPV
ncbi:MAG TPA: site-2 protease family protein [Gaiellales bacterium]|jgi:Zn-dependent protease|nr:site-2 protease family protein [Gaiellales bacterium]